MSNSNVTGMAEGSSGDQTLEPMVMLARSRQVKIPRSRGSVVTMTEAVTAPGSAKAARNID